MKLTKEQLTEELIKVRSYVSELVDKLNQLNKA